jgi:hypothetical protein
MTDFTNAVALEISRLLSNWQAGRELAAALARKFPRLTSVELDEALRDVIALRDLAAAEIAESERQLARLKAELQTCGVTAGATVARSRKSNTSAYHSTR